MSWGSGVRPRWLLPRYDEDSSVKTKDRAASIAVATVLGMLVVSDSPAEGPAIYGQFNVSLDRLDNDAESAWNVSSNASRIGIRGDIDIREGLKAIYQVETEIRVDTGSGAWATRDTFLGLRGEFGTVRAGQFDTPVKTIGRRVELFGDQFGDARNLTRVAAGSNIARFDERARNSIAYATPMLSGMQLIAHYSTNAAPIPADDPIADQTVGNNDHDLLSLAVHYADSRTFLGLGYETAGNPAGPDDPSILRFGAYYDIVETLRVNALYQAVSGTDAAFDQDVYGFGARYRMKAWAFKMQAYRLSGEAVGTDATLFAIGVDHALAKSVMLYLNYAILDNGGVGRLVPWGQGRGDNGLIPAEGETASGISFGAVVGF